MAWNLEPHRMCALTKGFIICAHPSGVRQAPVMGIPEWYCWYHDWTDFSVVPDRIMEDCIDAQTAAGINQIVWNCGRSRVDYHSELPNVTRTDWNVDAESNSAAGFHARVLRQYCPLRRTLAYCREQGVPCLGRLAMNRHYGSPEEPEHVARLAALHPEFYEKARNGTPVMHKLCYAIPEVRQERLDVLLEVQRIGVDALVLDYCRQVPILMYHEALVEPFQKQAGYDPREIASESPAGYREWFQYRADILTGFMRTLREAVRRQEAELGRACPIVARVPDNAEWLMRAFGLDLERWLAEDLIDATMLSPFPLAVEDFGRHPEEHAALAHRFGKACIGGIGSLNLIRGDGAGPNGHPVEFYDPRPVYELADRQYRAGVDAMSIYQTETVARMEYLQPLLREIGDKQTVARRVAALAASRFPADYPIGLDWHSKREAGYGLSRKAPHSLRGRGQLAL